MYGCAHLLATTVSAGDVDECSLLTDSLAPEHLIPPSIPSPGRPAVFCDPGVRLPFLTRFDRVRVYGVEDREGQNSIIGELQRMHDKLK
jgi:hypothetical protein